MKNRRGIKDFKNLIFKSEFSKNVLTLASGTTVAQVLPFAFGPILSRIYSPEDFGLLGVYMAVVQILITMSTARYEMGIMLPKRIEESVHMTLLSIIISAFFSFVLLVVVVIFKTEIAILLGNDLIENWLFLVPLSVFIISIYNSLNYFNLKRKEFKTIAFSKIHKSSGEVVLQLTFSFIEGLSNGLIIGYFFSHIFGNIKMIKNLLKEKQAILKINIKTLKKFIIRYKVFPLFSLPSIVFNTIALQLPVLFISRSFNLTQVGYYSFMSKYITAPISLIGTAIGQVYFQQLSENKDNNEKAKKIFIQTLGKLLTIGLFIFVPMYFLIVPLFEFIFGSEWTIAGEYGKILIPLIFIRFVVSPLSISNIVYEKEKVSLMINILLAIIVILVILVSKIQNHQIEQFLSLLTFLLSLGYIIFLTSIWYVIKR